MSSRRRFNMLVMRFDGVSKSSWEFQMYRAAPSALQKSYRFWNCVEYVEHYFIKKSNVKRTLQVHILLHENGFIRNCRLWLYKLPPNEDTGCKMPNPNLVVVSECPYYSAVLIRYQNVFFIVVFVVFIFNYL